ncbi:MAG: FkbM family methyltransferase [Opitutaceae bacterium]|nr:FkbM family methyltransferase [Opitutaceae bacterium]
MKPRERSPLWRRAVRLAARQLFRLAENNDDPRMERNGEAWLLRALLAAHRAAGAGRPFVAIDGGANRGDYSRAIFAAARAAGLAAEVHAFEPAPACVAALRSAFGAEKGFHLVPHALSDRAGEATLHDGREGSSQASLVPRAEHAGGSAAAITVPLARLDDYLGAQGITRVDLLKLDVEGHELAALRGLGDRLRPGEVDAIQFEYGGAALDAGTTLRDLYRLLEARGYVLAKLFPRALERRSYRPWMEHYAYANYVALAPRPRPAA